MDAVTPPPLEQPSVEPAAPKLAEPPRAHWVRRALAAVAKWAYANVLVVIFGPWLVGLVFREQFHLTGLCLLVPSPVVAALLIGVALAAWLVACRRAALAAALLALVPLTVVMAVENRWWRAEPPAPEGKTLRLVNWNVGGGLHGWDEIVAQLQAQKADIYVLSEMYSDPVLEELLLALGPTYAVERVHALTIIVRGTVRRPSEPRVPGRAYLFLCSVDGVPVSVLVADLPSLPIINRAPFLRQVRAIADQTHPDIIVGDFNTPRHAFSLSHLPEGYAHAYYLAGRGWSYTWPAQLPLWAIDHCIVGPRLQAVRYDLVTAPASDHRMQVLDFGVRPADSASP